MDLTLAEWAKLATEPHSEDLCSNLERALKLIRNLDHVNRWLKLNKRNIFIVKKFIRNGKIENKIHLEANLGLLMSYHRKLYYIKQSFLKQGGGRGAKHRHLIWQELGSYFKDRVRTGVIVNIDIKDPIIFLNKSFHMFCIRIKRELLKHPVKVYAVLSGNFVKPITKDEDVKTFYTVSKEIFLTTDLKQWFSENVKDKLLKKLEEFQEKDLGWALDSIINMRIHINKYTPLTIGTFCPLPPMIRNKKACVNIRNGDQHCFLWSIMAALFPTDKTVHRVSSYPHYRDHLKIDNLTFPMTLNQISKFLKMNPNLCLTIFAYKFNKKELEIYPVYMSKNRVGKKIHLLIMENGDSHHFCYIKNLSKLVGKQVGGHGHKLYICERCLNYFHTDQKLQHHLLDCGEHKEAVKIKMPEPDTHIKFENFKRQERVPYIVYADFEAMLIPLEDSEHASNTVKTQRHVPYSVGFYLHCSHDGSQSFYREYRGEKCVEWFLLQLREIAIKCEFNLSQIMPMHPLTPKEKEEFANAKKCYICDHDFNAQDMRVHDHCHLTGRYRGPAHNNCNLNYQDSRVIPIVMHNLSGYDSHFIIRPLLQVYGGNVNIIPTNKEKYISFTKTVGSMQLRFIDSYRFLASSLEELASYLHPNKKSILHSQVPDIAQFSLLVRKGVFPYEHITCWERLQETNLPAKNAFYNKLKDEPISDEDYAHALNVWDAFNLHTLGQYSDLYMKTDVLLLADIFENFRDSCMDSYTLDPAHYYTLPGYTWDAMLKFTSQKLELLHDIDQLLFIEKGIRGGVSQCSNRYACANNKYMREGYNPSKEEHYLMYYDVVNLYGHAMSQYLPHGNFQWVTDVIDVDVNTVADDSPVGYILEVDLKIPQHLHDYFKDLPPCPENKEPPNSKEKRLLCTLFDKERYVVHYRNLKLYLDLGVQVTKYHRILQFDQSPWLASYIDFNTKKRMQAQNDFEKALFKMFINAIFGKTMENLRKHRSVLVRHKWEGKHGIKHLIAQPNFHSMITLDNDVSIVEMKKTDIYFNKPIYIGFCILDISKTFVYDFHYKYMYQRYGEANVKLLYTDTDSLVYDVMHKDMYPIMIEDIHRFDTSDYHPNNIYGMPLLHKKERGLMSDENAGNVMLEFVGLRSKMYSVRVQDQKETKKAKGLKSAAARTLTFDDYLNCLNNQSMLFKTQISIQSKHHTIFTIKQTKIGLSPFDKKRCLLPNSTDTLPWGYNSVSNYTTYFFINYRCFFILF